jgi:hypothetical protein
VLSGEKLVSLGELVDPLDERLAGDLESFAGLWLSVPTISAVQARYTAT